MAYQKARIVVCDVETGGLVAGHHEILEIAMVPTDETFHPLLDLAFKTTVRPDFPDRLDPGALKVNGRLREGQPLAEAVQEIMDTHTIDRVASIRAFGEWWKDVCYGKQIAPMAQNWAFDFGFLEYSWMNVKHDPKCSFKNFVQHQARDTQRVVMYMLDRAQVLGQPKPFGGSTSLSKVAASLGISNDEAHTAFGDCVMTAAVYRKLVGVDQI